MNSTFDFENLINVLRQNLKDDAEFIYLMGSAGTDRFHEKSDVDIAVFWKVPPELKETLQICSRLEEVLNREIDLISLNKVDPIFSRQVLETGRLIYVGDSATALHLKWLAEKLSEYPDFKFSRKKIEDQILVRKKYV